MTTISIDYKFNEGRNDGKSIKDVIKNDYKYLYWFLGRNKLRPDNSIMEYCDNHAPILLSNDLIKVIDNINTPFNEKVKKLLYGNPVSAFGHVSMTDSYKYFNAKRHFRKYEKIKSGRFIKYLLRKNDVEHTDNDIEEWINTFRASIDGLNNFHIVEGEDIRKWYNYKLAKDIPGSTLANSCARNYKDYLDERLNLYVDNPEQIKMLIKLDDNGKLIGRALIWKNVHYETDGRNYIYDFMDRIYSINDVITEKFKMYAIRNDLAYRQHQTYKRPKRVILPGHRSERVCNNNIHIKNHKHKKYPYLDILKGYDGEGNFTAKKSVYRLGVIDEQPQIW